VTDLCVSITETVTPSSGCELRSTTVPVMFGVCVNPLRAIAISKQQKSNSFLISFIVFGDLLV
jgi:hypothetical protein